MVNLGGKGLYLWGGDGLNRIVFSLEKGGPITGRSVGGGDGGGGGGTLTGILRYLRFLSQCRQGIGMVFLPGIKSD